MRLIIPIKNIKEGTFGGKADQIIKMKARGIRVPETWVISSHEVTDALKKKGLINETGEIFNLNNLKLFFDRNFDLELFFGLLEEIKDIKKQNRAIRRFVVRSSHEQEDGAEYSFSGLFHTELNLSGAVEIVMAILKCWRKSLDNSLNTYMGKEAGYISSPCSLILQEFIPSDAAGVVFRSGDKIYINANYGLAKSVVDGNTGCDSWIFHEHDRESVSRETNKSHAVFPVNSRINPLYGDVVCFGRLEGLVVDEYNNCDQVIRVTLPKNLKQSFCMDDNGIQRLICLCEQVSSVLGIPDYDIEWACQGEELVILQCRPLTRQVTGKKAVALEGAGLGLVKGEAAGYIYTVTDEESAKRFPKGGILGVKRLEGSAILAATKAAGCILESKSLLSHSAIIARELGIPAVGAVHLSDIKWNKLYYLNGETGEYRLIKEDDGLKFNRKEEEVICQDLEPEMITMLEELSLTVGGDFGRRLKCNARNGDEC
ncbi:PEP/pyruvate-binding domain-containing protein [Clostridium sp. E02]|uniref:PEP/pyruvate-binding domain-containing protein n=1 Tax=Clostridium sp. E02 TaxID=2487134 RepID=UPI000F52BE08|nr:PEP/pyruvate-binding domain-containing protein [Clostridium sp. E02]